MYFSHKIINVVSLSFIGLSNVCDKKCEKKMDLSVVPLHKYPQYKTQCCRLINSEWQRSETARLRSLDSSRDKLPTCLVLLKVDKVIGHCKLSPIPSIPDGCFVESVVIEKAIRGQGYGKYLMEKAEEYCRSFLSLRIVYLSTKGQEAFYFKLGYSVCEPISIFGCYIPNRQYLTNCTINNKESLPRNHNSKTYMNKCLR